jgi:hypothetical protein
VSFRRVLGVALLAVVPGTAQAQFTTFIPQKNKLQDSVKAAAVSQQKAQADSVTTAALTKMKTWVDSAAGVVAPTTHADTVIRAGDSVIRVADPLATTAAETTTFREGSRAPSTASPLPLVALVGLTLLAAGLGLQRAPARRDGA